MYVLRSFSLLLPCFEHGATGVLIAQNSPSGSSLSSRSYTVGFFRMAGECHDWWAREFY